MLVLSRRVNEQIVIGDGPDMVTIKVVDIDRGKIRLGVQAPASIKVDRAEVREQRKGDKGDGE
jgi:carbon storage regulator